MMPPGVEPIALFRTFARNLPMAEAMHGWGSYELSPAACRSPMRQRELVIDRVTARCGCEYEWGVHVAFFAERVGLTPAAAHVAHPRRADDDCWTDPGERPLLALVDALHDDARRRRRPVDRGHGRHFDDAAAARPAAARRLVPRHLVRGQRRTRRARGRRTPLPDVDRIHPSDGRAARDVRAHGGP